MRFLELQILQVDIILTLVEGFNSSENAVFFLQEITRDGPLAVMVGAGFSIAHLRIFPTFRWITAELLERHSRWADGFPYGHIKSSLIYEWLAQRKGRIALIEAVHETTGGKICLRLPEEWLGPWPRGKAWGNRPDERLIWYLPGPAWVLARLIAERVVDVVLTTNWDTLVETYARASGITLMVPNDSNPSVTGRNDMPPDVVTLRVVETREDYYKPWAHESEIVKYNGGAFTSRHVLDHVRVSEADRSAWERIARRAFVVSSTDLGSWRGESWAEDLVKETFRHHKVLVLGVSGRDNVFYVTVKEIQIEELRVAERRIQRGDTYESEPKFFVMGYQEDPNLVELFAYPYSEDLRREDTSVRSVLMFQKSERFPEWRSGLWSLMLQVYARLMLRRIRESNRLFPHILQWLEDQLDREARDLARITVESFWGLQENVWLTLVLNVMMPFWARVMLDPQRASLHRVVGDYRAAFPYVPFFAESDFLARMLEWIYQVVAEMGHEPRAFPAPGLVVGRAGERLVIPNFPGQNEVRVLRLLREWSETYGTPLPPVEFVPLIR